MKRVLPLLVAALFLAGICFVPAGVNTTSARLQEAPLLNDEILEQERTHLVSIVVTCVGPDLIHDTPSHPRALHGEGYQCWAGHPFSSTQNFIGGGWKLEDGSNPPDHLTGLGRRKKQ